MTLQQRRKKPKNNMLLDNINNPADIRKLSIEQLTTLAGEIRQRMVEVVSKTGGHLASSLGAVELIITLHYCLDTPRDKIIFDVGHQTYAHKILTGRNKDFDTLRQYGGISGFPSHIESEYDCFTTGHSSTAISLALGLACARDLKSPEERFKVVAVVGDGSLSGGLAFEGLNNTGHLNKDILVILNTNELSIAPNVGALSVYLNKIISLPVYNRFHTSLENFVKSRVPKGSRLLKLASKFEEGLKGLFIPGMLFEELGFRYFGPLDGHNLALLTHTLKNILQIPGPRLLHIVTKKGQGYEHAENEPVRFHGTPPFEIETGAPKSRPGVDTALTYTAIFGKKLIELAQNDKRIVAITAAMPEGTGLDKFAAAYPDRLFDVGIAEEHAVCFAAGLAKDGLKPIVAVYSTFLQRAYDEIMECVALQKLPVIFAIDRAGIVGEDGVTHQGVFDIAYLRSIPNLVMMAPKDGVELEKMLEFAMSADMPAAIRYPKEKVQTIEYPGQSKKIELGKAEVLKTGKDIAIVALGCMVLPSLGAAEILEKEGISVTVVNARFVRPLDIDLLRTLKAKFIFTVEDGVAEGGFGSAVQEALGEHIHRLGLPLQFIAHGKRDILLEKYGLTSQGIAKSIKDA